MSVIQVSSNEQAPDDGVSPLRDTQDLRWIAGAFESAQAQRLRTGDQVRTLVQSGAVHGISARGVHEVESLLARIRAGAAPAPLATLSDAYRRQWNEER